MVECNFGDGGELLHKQFDLPILQLGCRSQQRSGLLNSQNHDELLKAEVHAHLLSLVRLWGKTDDQRVQDRDTLVPSS